MISIKKCILITIILLNYIIIYSENWIPKTNIPTVNNEFVDIKILDSNNLFITTKDTIFYSNNQGMTWKVIKTPDSIKTIYSSSILTTSHLWIATSKGVYESIDSGKIWAQQSTVKPHYIKFINDSIGLSLIYGNGDNIYKTTNKGKDWKKVLYANISSFEEIQLLDDKIGFVIGNTTGSTNEVYIYKTTDYGNTWENVYSDVSNSNNNYRVGMYALHILDYFTIFAGGEHLLKSTDGGNSWSEIINNTITNSPQCYRTSDIFFINDTVGYTSTFSQSPQSILISNNCFSTFNKDLSKLEGTFYFDFSLKDGFGVTVSTSGTCYTNNTKTNNFSKKIIVNAPNNITLTPLIQKIQYSSTISLTNVGKIPFKIDSVKSNLFNISYDNASIYPYNQTLISYSFTPDTIGSIQDSILIYFANYPDNYVIKLTGNVEIPLAKIKTDSICEFDSVLCGSSKLKNISIYNIGNIDLVIDSIILPSDFNYTLNQTIIHPNQSVNLCLDFSPTIQLNYEDTLKIFSNSNSPIYNILLKGYSYNKTRINNINESKIEVLNPISESINIKLDKPYEKVSLEIFNINGKLITIKSYRKIQDIEFNFNNQPVGIYFLKIDYNNTINSIKILKNK